MLSATHLHAMLVHFPIALLVMGFLSEAAGLLAKKEFFKKAGLYMLLLGAAGAAAAYFSGNAAGEGMEDGTMGQAIELHEQAAMITFVLAALAAALRVLWETMKTKKTWLYALAFLLYGATIGAVARTGYLGGQLVYKHGAGIELGVPANTGNAADTDDDAD